MQYTYNIPQAVKQVLNRWDLLGHDDVKRAAESIILHETWDTDYDLHAFDAEDIKIIKNWRDAVMLNNGVNGVTTSIMQKFFGI